MMASPPHWRWNSKFRTSAASHLICMIMSSWMGPSVKVPKYKLPSSSKYDFSQTIFSIMSLTVSTKGNRDFIGWFWIFQPNHLFCCQIVSTLDSSTFIVPFKGPGWPTKNFDRENIHWGNSIWLSANTSTEAFKRWWQHFVFQWYIKDTINCPEKAMKKVISTKPNSAFYQYYDGALQSSLLSTNEK